VRILETLNTTAPHRVRKPQIHLSPSQTHQLEMEPAPYRQLQKSFTAKLKLETKVNLEWKNINYHMMIKNPKSTPFNSLYDHKHILDGINGSALAGEMIAIMGPTGCGKTSLLNVLAARAPYGSKQDTKLDGQIFVNGEPRDDASFRALSAYVLQDDRLFPHLTVFETLTIASHFYLPTNMPDGEKAELVTAIIAELGLVKAKDTIIGDEKVRGVSGGERRRASIAVQMISNPTVLFLDEPTSGLDSFQAQSVMEAMKSIAMNNRLVISVIHQPRSSIYNMFDRLLLLSEGKQMYFGPAADAVTYFIKAGYPCPARFNPSDFFLDILSPDNRSPELEEQSNKRINNFSELYKGKHPIEFTSIADKPFTLPKSGAWKMPDIKRIVRNFRFLAWRSFTEQMRDLPTILIRFFTSCFFGLIIGAVYSNTKHDQQGIQNITGLLFLITLNQAFNNLFTVGVHQSAALNLNDMKYPSCVYIFRLLTCFLRRN
jgi:ABC-type multidrug transport system ATPase subunit